MDAWHVLASSDLKVSISIIIMDTVVKSIKYSIQLKPPLMCMYELFLLVVSNWTDRCFVMATVVFFFSHTFKREKLTLNILIYISAGFIIPRCIQQHLKVTHNDAWDHDTEKNPTQLWTTPNCSTLQSPGVSQLERNHLSGSYSCSKKEIKHCKARAPKETQKRKEDLKMLPQAVY